MGCLCSNDDFPNSVRGGGYLASIDDFFNVVRGRRGGQELNVYDYFNMC